ncbi:hypothetical protein PMAYCL1PPCAC_01514, partial [Pristionchus mayeri]
NQVEDPLFIRRSKCVQGEIGGVRVEAVLDTGAEVSLIDKRTVDKMQGVVVMPPSRSYQIKDAQGNPMVTLGVVALYVNMEIGRKCKAGFFVAEKAPAILLERNALAEMGLELREECPQMKRSVDSAVVLRTSFIAPGEMGMVLVGGGLRGQGPKVLISDREEVVEGMNDGDVVVRVPVWNGTDEDLRLEIHDVIGEWQRVKNTPVEDSNNSNDLKVNMIGRSNRRIDWNEIRRNLEVCRNGKLSSRVEAIIKARADVFAVNDDDLGRLKNVRLTRSKTAVARFEEEERKRKIEEQIVEDRILKQWSDDQSKDEWVVSMLEKVKEVEKGKREITEEVTVPGSTKRTSLADWIPQANPLYTVDMDVDEYKRRMCWMMERARGTVVAKLETERRKMKEKYDDKHKHNMKVKPVPGDRVYLRVEAKMGDVRKMMDNYEGPYRVIPTSNTTARVVRADDGLESGREKDERVVQWDRLRLVPREEEEEVEVCMVECNINEGKEMNEGHFRTRVKVGSILHPDGICTTCRPTKIGETKLVEDPMLVPWKDKKFSSLRELAAFIDRKEQSKKLDSWELSKAIDESCLEKDVTTLSLKMAYRKGMCPCACDLAKQVALFGVEFEEEETRISDAISEVLARSGKRSSRKKMVVLIPDDSVITTCGGSFREAEGMKYADETEMRKILSDMKGKNLPESLVVLLKKSLGDSMLKLVKKNLLVLAKEEDISIYVTTDLLPKKSDLYTQESINALQECFVLWNSEKKQKNIMIMSPVSGLLEKTYALATLFPVARKESKWLFEQALRHIVYGEVLP